MRERPDGNKCLPSRQHVVLEAVRVPVKALGGTLDPGSRDTEHASAMRALKRMRGIEMMNSGKTGKDSGCKTPMSHLGFWPRLCQGHEECRDDSSGLTLHRSLVTSISIHLQALHHTCTSAYFTCLLI